MSTYLYLHCLSHDPPLSAREESGHDLDQIRADIRDRDSLAHGITVGAGFGDRFRHATARFLAEHPRCRIGIRDEYGIEYGIERAAISEETA